jgi:hypothetical protein
MAIIGLSYKVFRKRGAARPYGMMYDNDIIGKKLAVT